MRARFCSTLTCLFANILVVRRTSSGDETVSFEKSSPKTPSSLYLDNRDLAKNLRNRSPHNDDAETQRNNKICYFLITNVLAENFLVLKILRWVDHQHVHSNYVSPRWMVVSLRLVGTRRARVWLLQ